MAGVKLPDKAAKRAFHRRLLAWYARHGRDLPWRRTREPYRVLVSEIMLQQTQVDRVIPKYHEFLARYPTFEDLARARARDVTARCCEGVLPVHRWKARVKFAMLA